MISIDDINTVYAEMPSRIHAYSVSNKDGTYTVVLNSRLSSAMVLMAYNHELKHILNGDYEKQSSVDIIEINAHA